jgi:hypothetical protein
MRRSGRDVRPPAVTSGAPAVTSGGTPQGFWRGAVAVIPILVVVCTINVFSHLHDAAAVGLRLPAWQPITWEATSAVTDCAALAVIWLALRVAPPERRRWPLVLLVHGLGTVAFSAIHVAGMWGLRVAIYAVVGLRYHVALSDAFYEYRKDVLAYLGFAVLLWLVPRLSFSAAGPPAAHPAPPRDACFDIQDGARILRVPLDEILAVRAAGNYVEFVLQDGRRPLMRAPLGEIEAALAPSGFLRTHRSWVVNTARVRALEPAGSGDYQLALEGGAQAPVSRRFPAAIERLRGGG